MHRIATKHYNRMRQLLSTVSVRRFRNKAARAALGIEHSQRLLCLLSSRAVKFSVLLLFIFFPSFEIFRSKKNAERGEDGEETSEEIVRETNIFPFNTCVKL